MVHTAHDIANADPELVIEEVIKVVEAARSGAGVDSQRAGWSAAAATCRPVPGRPWRVYTHLALGERRPGG